VVQMTDVYTVRERKTVCETKLFSVFTDELVDVVDDVIAPDYLVVAPKHRTQEGITGIVVVPFVGDKVGLVRVFRHAVAQSGWEVPRGFVDQGETTEAAALRELEEEAGLSCNHENLLAMGCIAPDPGILDARIRCFAAMDCTLSGKEREEEFGHREFRLFARLEIEQLIRDGDIQDSVSLAAYYRSRIEELWALEGVI